MMFDGNALARGWLAVALAESSDRDRPQFYRSVHVEEFDAGLRITATDSYVVLRTFVPTRGADETDYPLPTDKPMATAVVFDHHGRGKGFLAHALKIGTTAPAQGVRPEALDVRVHLGEVASHGDTHAPILTGFETAVVVLSHDGPDAERGGERVELDVYEGGYPDVSAIIDSHVARASAPTDRILLNPDVVARLAKVAKFHGRASLGWTFAGDDQPARVSFPNSDPYVDGLVMPRAWDLEQDSPYVTGPPADGPDADELEGQQAASFPDDDR